VPDVEAVGPVHVGGLADDDAVERHDGHGVEPGADQVDPVGGPVGVPVERGLVDPVGAADPGQPGLVVVEVGVGDQAGGEQVGVHATRNAGRDTGVRGAGERPAVVQRNDAHNDPVPPLNRISKIRYGRGCILST
jgi:hypothetical protein